MTSLLLLLRQPWPWYVAGPLIGLMVPALLLVDNRTFGISSNLRHVCAIVMPGQAEFFRYDWRGSGAWNLAFAAGVVLGGMLAARSLASMTDIALSSATLTSLRALGVHDVSGMVPRELVSWRALATVRGLVMLVGGGFLVGFGAAYAGGCTSGHAISGLADRQLPSLIAVIGFFAGGLMSVWIFLPLLLGGAR